MTDFLCSTFGWWCGVQESENLSRSVPEISVEGFGAIMLVCGFVLLREWRRRG